MVVPRSSPVRLVATSIAGRGQVQQGRGYLRGMPAPPWSPGAGTGAEGAGGGGAPDEDRDAVQAKRGGGPRAERGRGQCGRDREVAHRGGQEQRRSRRPAGARAEEAADDGRGREKQRQGPGDGGVTNGEVDLGGDEGDQGRDRGERGAGGGRLRPARREGAGNRAGQGPQGDADRKRERDDHGQVRDDTRRGEAGPARLQGQDRGGEH